VTKDADDSIRLDAMDLEFRVVTSPVEVRRFIERETPCIKVVFSTYQSLPVVSEGILGLAPFDVAIFDEAHKTTGPQGGLFAHGLKDENIRIRKRLFLTATPRHYDIRHRDKEGNFRIVSMDDETIYGPRAYTLTFGSAARQGVICNYKVVISVVDGQEINEFALKHGITLIEGDLIGARWVANQIAVERAIKKTGAKRAITFHSRVSRAKEFSADSSRGIRQFLHGFSVFHVNGDQKSSVRKQLIRAFRDAENGLITNARCLTEGIDVPAVDMVAFIDLRHSEVDIAQATGRAMRKPRESDKNVGYVVIPLFLERKTGETLEEALDRSDFADVANVLNAMQEQDDDLAQIIREIKEEIGREKVFNPRRLSDKVEVIGPLIKLSTLKSNIFAKIVEKIGNSWDEWFGVLLKYYEREGHCRVPHAHGEGGYKLGGWILTQRQNVDKMPPERKRRLDELGFVWDPLDESWETGFAALVKYKEREGHCRVPNSHREGDYRLGSWVNAQRAAADRMLPDRKKRLDELGFVWGVLGADWENGFTALVKFAKREGHCRVPANYIEGDYRLGQWVSVQRGRVDKMSPDRKKRLDELGFIWDVLAAKWEDAYAALVRFKEREGHCRVPARHIEGDYRLGAWVNTQRTTVDKMSPERKKRLDNLGFVWDLHDADWENAHAALVRFTEREGHCRVPVLHIEGDFNLGMWVSNQRTTVDKMPRERKKRLDELGFAWEPFGADWENRFAALVKFKIREGHCRVPLVHIEGDYRLGAWVNKQRATVDKMSPDRKNRLDELGFVWGPQRVRSPSGRWSRTI
jgi:superfamily II DNA or RNA helicase